MLFDIFNVNEKSKSKAKLNNTYISILNLCVTKEETQTRTLRVVYHFIKLQCMYIDKTKNFNILFINILDGDECFSNKSKFNFLLESFQNNVKDCIYIGDLSNFQIYWNENKLRFQ